MKPTPLSLLSGENLHKNSHAVSITLGDLILLADPCLWWSHFSSRWPSLCRSRHIMSWLSLPDIADETIIETSWPTKFSWPAGPMWPFVSPSVPDHHPSHNCLVNAELRSGAFTDSIAWVGPDQRNLPLPGASHLWRLQACGPPVSLPSSWPFRSSAPLLTSIIKAKWICPSGTAFVYALWVSLVQNWNGAMVVP